MTYNGWLLAALLLGVAFRLIFGKLDHTPNKPKRRANDR